MKRLTFWAPDAPRVDVVDTQGNALAMQLGAREWEVDVADDVAATGYKFSIDGDEPIPDPRSRRQPDGVHGYSVLAAANFAWADASWKGVDLASSVLYELHVGTFSTDGTFSGVLNHLDHLQKLGVNVIELMPVAEFAGTRGWGYDAVDLWAPYHQYGRPDELKTLVNECHRSGIGVFLDVVYNHVGPEGNYLKSVGPYFTAEHRTPWGDAINYNDAQSDGVRAFVLDNATMWLTEFHLDGLRLDATHAIIDDSPSHIVRDIVTKARAIATERGVPALITVESELNDPVTVEVDGWNADAQWNDDFHHCLHVAMTGERHGYYQDYDGLDDLVEVLNRNFSLADKWSPHRHKVVGRSAAHIDHGKFIGFIQNHDHVGNRAQGERIHRLAPDPLLYVASALTILGPFVPLLFQGEEWNASSPFMFFTDYQVPALAEAVREGRAREFEAFAGNSAVPDPQDEQTFLDSKLNWDEVGQAEHAHLLSWYKELISLRHKEDDFRSGATRAERDGDTLLMRRGNFLVAANFGTNEAHLDEQFSDILLQHGTVRPDEHVLHLGPHSIAVACTFVTS